MKKSTMIMVVLTVITMGLAIPLGAQTSNQSVATASVFGTDVDNYMNVNNYGDVEFDKWFGYLRGNWNGTIALGYATKFGDIYLGGYYTGNIFRSDTNETKRLTTTWDPVLQQLDTREDETTYTQTTTNTNNNIEALIGVAGMGIKVGFSENITTYNTPYNVSRNGTNTTRISTVTQNADGSITYSGNDSINYEESTSSLTPSVQWGMKLNLGSGTLAPRVNANVNFYRNTFIDEYYSLARTEINGKNTGQERITRAENNQDYIRPLIGVGADYYFNDNFYVGLDYTFRIYLYSNDYSGAGRSGSVNGTANASATLTTTNYFDRTNKSNEVNLTASERSEMSHSITPTLWKTSTIGENLQLGVSFRLPVSITKRTTNGYTDLWRITETTYNDASRSNENTKTTYESHTAGTKQEYSYLSIGTNVGIGASYNLIPGRFTINTGVNLNPISYSNTSTVTSRNGVNSTYSKTETGSGSNKYISDETRTVTNPTNVQDTVENVTNWYGFSGSVVGGFVFSFYDNFALDMVASRGTDPAGTSSSAAFNLNISNVSLMFTFKF